MDRNEFIGALIARKHELHREFIPCDSGAQTLQKGYMGAKYRMCVSTNLVVAATPYYYVVIAYSNTRYHTRARLVKSFDEFVIKAKAMIKDNSNTLVIICKMGADDRPIEINRNDRIVKELNEYHSDALTKWITESNYDDFESDEPEVLLVNDADDNANVGDGEDIVRRRGRFPLRAEIEEAVIVAGIYDDVSAEEDIDEDIEDDE